MRAVDCFGGFAAAKHSNRRRRNQCLDLRENALNRLAMAAVSVY
jgi:hypothetical protein